MHLCLNSTRVSGCMRTVHAPAEEPNISNHNRMEAGLVVPRRALPTAHISPWECFVGFILHRPQDVDLPLGGMTCVNVYLAG